MEKTRVIKRKYNLKHQWKDRNPQFKDKSINLAHPVVRASYLWSILSEQLCDVLGPSIHHEVFTKVKPTVISHNVLILEVPSHHSARWIHTHYQELIDLLLSAIDKKLSCFFISQTERSSGKGMRILAEGPATEIKR